jgi:hypothetical protein
MRSLNRLILLTLLVLLAGCAGTGSRNYAEMTSQIDSTAEGKLFLLRDKGFVGGGLLMKVLLNGKQVAEVGSGEMIALMPTKGTNYLQGSIGGLIQMDSRTIQFESDGKAHRYFIASIQQGFFSNELKLTETVEGSWRAEASGAR